MPSLDRDQNDVDIDLAQLFRAIWQRKGLVLGATVLAGGLAFVGANAIAPSYKSDAKLLIESGQPNFSASGTASLASEPLPDELNIASQVQLLQSTDLMKQVARDLKLYELAEFDPDSRASALTDFLVLFGLQKNPLELAPEERVLKTFRQNLAVYQLDKSRVIAVEFTSKDPKLAAAVPNAIIGVYRSLQSGAKLDSNSEAVRWMETEIANLRGKVREAEQSVAEYRSSVGLMPLGSDQTSFTSKQLADISTELARVRGERAAAEATAENLRATIKAGKPTDTLEAVAGSESIRRLNTTESQIRAQIADASTRLLDGHPQMKALRSQLSGIRQQIQAELLKVAAGLENQAAVAREQETQLVAQLNTVKADTARAGEDEVELKSLEREAAAQRQLLETYLARYREASSRLDKDASPADARLISAAIEPADPSFPKVLPITIVTTLATLILLSIIVMLIELFSGRAVRQRGYHVAGPLDVEDVPVAAEPRSVARGNLDVSAGLVEEEPVARHAVDDMADLVVPDDRTEEDDQFSAAAVADYLVEEATSIAFAISPSGDEGSEGTVALTRELARRGRRVVLVDMTGSGWPTQLMTHGSELSGITDLLTGDAAFADCIHPDRLSAADIVPQGNADIRQAMRGADRLTMIVDALADAYDLVIVECGPAQAEGVARLSRNGTHEIILSAPEPDERELAEIMAAFEAVGYSDLVLMSARLPQSDRDRDAA
ncbi:exopolysaccharide transport family protein [Rhizobium sp. AAP43]|uniref:GumC family protein n=1 Tax=Rhizobium sp. AAP43 TaxID=1523420 RepID=UPI0006B9967D|nr:exopolysaccharide transport family protein [Rhizobium sp. AAP43]KPF43124.1 chain-length determining protein [Rhizobium sp. AAP43]